MTRLSARELRFIVTVWTRYFLTYLPLKRSKP